jgi:glyoxylase-like metal-dependent hydrolase (beta-lactamase superfamily II)
MFGVVAKPLWAKHFEADERNRIKLALRCLLVEHDAGPVLIDTGIGNKEDEKFLNIYGVENSGASSRTMLEDALSEAGVRPEDVRYVINTHLHFDHAGGNTYVVERETGQDITARAYRRTGCEPRHSFPNATYVVQRGELEAAVNPNERTAASYLADNFQPVSHADAWRLVEGEAEIVPGISVIRTPGHTPFHQSVLISDGDEVACYAGDCVPTAAHVPLAWIMAYDLEPLMTLEAKRELLGRAEAEGWTMVFEHDPKVATGRVTRDSKSYVCLPLDTASGQA